MPSNIAQDVTQWNLPEKAKARFGKGRIRNLTYFPDGTRLAVWSSIGIWIYDVRTGAEIDLFAPMQAGHWDSVSPMDKRLLLQITQIFICGTYR